MPVHPICEACSVLNRVEMAAAQRRLARRAVTMDGRPQLAVRAGADSLPQIDHIVMLMLENHAAIAWLRSGWGRYGCLGSPTASSCDRSS